MLILCLVDDNYDQIFLVKIRPEEEDFVRKFDGLTYGDTAEKFGVQEAARMAQFLGGTESNEQLTISPELGEVMERPARVTMTSGRLVTPPAVVELVTYWY
jgi:hypothetical protein